MTNASWALPSCNIRCAGRIERKESSSGAPKKMLGIKSRNVWVMDMATINITKTIGGIGERNPIEETRIEATRFMWMPGERPVNVPAIRPTARARIYSNIIYFYFLISHF